MDPVTDPWMEALERRHLADLTGARCRGPFVRSRRATCSGGEARRGGAVVVGRKARGVCPVLWPSALCLVTEDAHAIRSRCRSRDEVHRQICRSRLRDRCRGCRVGIWLGGAAIQRVGSLTPGQSRRPLDLPSIPVARRAGRANLADTEASTHHARRCRPLVVARGSLRPTQQTSFQPDGPLRASSCAARSHSAEVRECLSVEPIARRLAGVAAWWRQLAGGLGKRGGRADEWRFPAALPHMPLDPGARGWARPPGAHGALAVRLALPVAQLQRQHGPAAPPPSTTSASVIISRPVGSAPESIRFDLMPALDLINTIPIAGVVSEVFGLSESCAR